MPPYGPSKATAVEAYWLHCDGLSYGQIAAKMAGPPHYCGGRTTAVDWVNRGRKIEAEHGGPMRKRRARREVVANAINAIRVRIAEDVNAGRFDEDRAKAYRLQLQALGMQSRLLGLDAPKEQPKAADDTKPVQIDPAVLRALAALHNEEFPEGDPER